MNTTLWNRVGIVMGFFVGYAGVMHFVTPDFFNDLVPPWLPPSESFWTYVSGIAEIAIAVMLFVPAWRHRGAIAAIALFVAVYPGNLYMAWDWRNEPFSDQLVSYGRLPFQFLFIWLAWKVAQASSDVDAPVVPGDVSLRG